jgi:hypothetical protein
MTPDAPARVAGHRITPRGCSATERGTASPALDPAFTKPFRWEIVPEPNPNCALVGPAGEADTREAAEAALRGALAAYVSATGYVYAVGDVSGAPSGAPLDVRELARVPASRPPDPKPPAW